METLGKLHRHETNRVYAKEKSIPPRMHPLDTAHAYQRVTPEQRQSQIQDSFLRIADEAKQYFTEEIANNPDPEEGLTLYWRIPVTEVAWDVLYVHCSPTHALGWGGKTWLSFVEWADAAGFRIRVENSVRTDGTQVFLKLQTHPIPEDDKPAPLPVDEVTVLAEFRESLIRITEMTKKEFTEGIQANHAEEYFRSVESYVSRREPAWNFLRFAKYDYQHVDFPDGLSAAARAVVEEVWNPFLAWLKQADLKLFLGMSLHLEGDFWRLEAMYVDEVEDRPCVKPMQ